MLTTKCLSFTITVIYCLLGHSVIVGSSNRQQTYSSYWGYQCIDNTCVKTVVTDDNRSQLTDLTACYLLCVDYGTLWPKPTGDIDRQEKLISLNINDIVIYHPSHQDQLYYWLNNVNRFDGILRLKASNSSVNSEGLSLIININVVNPSIDLNIDTNEEYDLSILEDVDKIMVEINADTYYGARHGLETLAQLVVFDSLDNRYKTIELQLTDAPVFNHRGILLDTASHYFKVESIKHTIDLMALNKLNVFHWHIADSKSFAMVLPSHPEFSKLGAYSANQVYTSDDIKDIVAYAKQRGIRVIPEFGAPGHVAEGFQGTDILSCSFAEPWKSYCSIPPCGQFDPTNDKSYEILEDIYHDMNTMFMEPDLFHIDGDEISTSCWDTSPHIKDYLVSMNFTVDNAGYLNLFAKFVDQSKELWHKVTGKNKKVIVWSSSLTTENNVDMFLNKDEFIVQIWNKASGSDFQVKQLVEKGYNVIISNADAFYLNCGAGSYTGTGNNWCTPFNPWTSVYNNDFKNFIGEDEKKFILGGEVCLFSDVANDQTLDAHLWPRASALAERLWSDPNTGSRDAYERIVIFRELMVKYGARPESVHPEWCFQNPGGCPL